MRTENFQENDVVRVTRALTGRDEHTEKRITIPRNEVGTIIAGSSAHGECLIEFVLQRENGDYYSATAAVTPDDLEPYAETAAS